MPAESSRRPLLVTADPLLLDDLLRLAAAAGAECEVAPDGATARRPWASAPLVIVGGDVAEAVGRGEPARRGGVYVVSRDLDDAEVWRRAVGLGAEKVAFLPDAEEWVSERLADAAEGGLSTAVTLCVVGGRGGAGASTLAVALAVTGIRHGHRTFLLDGDPLGGGIDMVLGGEDTSGLRWPDLAATRGRVSGAALHDALPRLEELTVLSWDRGDTLTIPGEAMRAVLCAAQRASDLVVVDLPRRLDEAAEVALHRSTVTLLLVPAEVRAAASAARVAAAVGLVAPDLRVVVRGPAPSGLSAEVIAGSMALPLAGEMRAEPGVAAALERGEPPARRDRGPLATFCRAFLGDVSGRPGSAAA